MNNKKYQQQLLKQREKIVKNLHLREMVRGTLLKRYLCCSRVNCRCHRLLKYRHGPYYFLSIRKKERSFHIYVPLNKVKEIKKWVKNYHLVWEGIEEITRINIELMRHGGKR